MGSGRSGDSDLDHIGAEASQRSGLSMVPPTTPCNREREFRRAATTGLRSILQGLVVRANRPEPLLATFGSTLFSIDLLRRVAER